MSGSATLATDRLRFATPATRISATSTMVARGGAAWGVIPSPSPAPDPTASSDRHEAEPVRGSHYVTMRKLRPTLHGRLLVEALRHDLIGPDDFTHGGGRRARRPARRSP